MPHDLEFTRHQRLLDDLERTVDSLAAGCGSSLEIRRARADLGHLRESLALLAEAAGRSIPAPRQQVVEIPDTPYDPELWRDAGDEGLGSRYGPQDR